MVVSSLSFCVNFHVVVSADCVDTNGLSYLCVVDSLWSCIVDCFIVTSTNSTEVVSCFPIGVVLSISLTVGVPEVVSSLLSEYNEVSGIPVVVFSS